MKLREVKTPAQKCDSNLSSKDGYGSESKYQGDAAIKETKWGYAENGRDWKEKYPACGLP